MARQYIGARYVPKFYEGSHGSEWDYNVAYEPLTIVTYLGNSYTSKKPIPAGVGNPKDNGDYWASTGIYNTQVEEYRQEVEEYTRTFAAKTQNLTEAGIIDSSDVKYGERNVSSELSELRTKAQKLNADGKLSASDVNYGASNVENEISTLRANVVDFQFINGSTDGSVQFDYTQTGTIGVIDIPPHSYAIVNARVGFVTSEQNVNMAISLSSNSTPHIYGTRASDRMQFLGNSNRQVENTSISMDITRFVFNNSDTNKSYWLYAVVSAGSVTAYPYITGMAFRKGLI